MRFDLVDLHLFLSIVDVGSITAGAKCANLALASAIERVRKIESDAGVALLEWRPRGVVATKAGGEGLCEMVSHGIGVGILPLSVARRYRRRHAYEPPRTNRHVGASTAMPVLQELEIAFCAYAKPAGTIGSR